MKTLCIDNNWARSSVPVYSVPDLLKESSDLEWMVHSILPKPCFAVFTADRYREALSLSLQLAVSVAFGKPFVGKETNTTRVLFGVRKPLFSTVKESLCSICTRLGIREESDSLQFVFMRAEELSDYPLWKELVTREKASLVVVDGYHTLNPFTVYNFLAWKEFAEKYDLCVVTVLSRNAGSEYPLEDLCDIFVDLSKKKNRKYLLSVRGAIIPEKEIVLNAL
jgi:hypothetical protein